MKECARCKHAEWKRTEAGKLHPSGDGKCGYAIKLPPLPACADWIGGTPMLSVLLINRRRPLDKHCPYWSQG